MVYPLLRRKPTPRRPQGAWSWTRAPRGARPYRRSRLVVLPVSSKHEGGDVGGAAAGHATRASTTAASEYGRDERKTTVTSGGT